MTTVGFQAAVLSPATPVAENAVLVAVNGTAWEGPGCPGTRSSIPDRVVAGPDQ
jgi:hypothetical protein